MIQNRASLLLLLFMLVAVLGCGGGTKMTQEERLKAARYSGAVSGNFEGELSELMLTQDDLPPGYSFVDGITCPSTQSKLMYEHPEMFKQSMPQPTLKLHQSVRGANGDEGSILYFQYAEPVSDATTNFIAGMLWGMGKKGPTPEKPEDFLTVSKIAVLWCLKPDSPAKKASQVKVRSQF